MNSRFFYSFTHIMATIKHYRNCQRCNNFNYIRCHTIMVYLLFLCHTVPGTVLPMNKKSFPWSRKITRESHSYKYRSILSKMTLQFFSYTFL